MGDRQVAPAGPLKPSPKNIRTNPAAVPYIMFERGGISVFRSTLGLNRDNLLVGFRRALLVCIAILVWLLPGTILPAVEPAYAKSGWGAGESKDSVSGEASSGTRRGGTSRQRCRHNCRRRTGQAPKTTSAEAKKSVVLPKPDIRPSPRVGLVGSFTEITIRAPGRFADWVEAGEARAEFEATPIKVQCSFDSASYPALMKASEAEAVSDPIRIPLSRAGRLPLSCTLFWDVQWTSNDGQSGTISDRESWASLDYPVLGVVSVLVE